MRIGHWQGIVALLLVASCSSKTVGVGGEPAAGGATASSTSSGTASGDAQGAGGDAQGAGGASTGSSQEGSSRGGAVSSSGGQQTSTEGSTDGAAAGGGGGVLTGGSSGSTAGTMTATGAGNVCEVGAARCSDQGDVERCVDGTWQHEETCTGEPPTCVDSACTVCVPDDQRCLDSGTLQVCGADGTWDGGTACSGDTGVCHDGACVHCMPGTSRCTDTTPEKCSSTGDEWQTQASCDGEAPVCLPESGSCGCETGTRRCRLSGSASERDECVGGVWQPSSSCAADAPVCHSDGECGCTPGDIRCDSPRVLASCSNDNEWATVTCNDSGSACDGKSCAYPASVPGLIGCGSGLVCDTDEQCCWHADSASVGTGECQAQVPFQTTCGTTEDDFEYDCDGPNDCQSGQVCCLTAYMRVYARCEQPANCATNSTVVCDRAQGTTGNPACPSGATCKALPNGVLWTCQT
jgi:hypothetical protein